MRDYLAVLDVRVQRFDINLLVVYQFPFLISGAISGQMFTKMICILDECTQKYIKTDLSLISNMMH